jgi:aryl-phospho-beta-D-glucosidase BglC (GH1 family)
MQRLRAVGNQLRGGDHAVRLRGVNLSGLEYSRGAVTPAILDEIAGWGANLVRVPFNQRWLLDDPGYLDELSLVAAEASARGLYVLFDLQWLDYGQRRGTNPDGSNQATPPLPDENSPRAWQLLARRFAPDPAVMLDLLNEPHDRLPDDEFPLHSADGARLPSPRVSPAEWHPWVHRLAAAIRPLAPETPLFVSGTDWGFQLARVNLQNVVYATHVYPYSGKRTRGDWQRGFGQLSERVPVVVTELGPVGDLAVMDDLLDFLDERDLGWAAWSWRDQPALTDASGPTDWGRLIRRRL